MGVASLEDGVSLVGDGGLEIPAFMDVLVLRFLFLSLFLFSDSGSSSSEESSVKI